MNKSDMPLKEIVDSNQNIYEITNVAIRRAAQLTLSSDESFFKEEGKVVSLALKEVMHKVVSYKIDQD
ncbi:MAG: DNA-directed RNA polymerase subunit omega [Spirochaetaceae bacterium]|nr:DNA-directed RNA polymerase subunit omega [Spirochaetaceae bacterium]